MSYHLYSLQHVLIYVKFNFSVLHLFSEIETLVLRVPRQNRLFTELFRKTNCMQIGSPVSDAAYMYANVNVNVVVLNAWQLVLVISLHIH